MAFSVHITEESGLAATIQSLSAVGTYSTDVIPLNSDAGRRFLAEINVGAIGTSGTVAFGFQWSATSGGTYAAITGASIATDTTGGKTHMVEVDTDTIITLYPTAQYIKGVLVIGTAATPVGVTVRAFEGAHNPIPDAAANVGQKIVTDAN